MIKEPYALITFSKFKLCYLMITLTVFAYVQRFIQQCGNSNFLRYVLFTDEAKFTWRAIVNFHNTCVWLIKNPMQNRYQYQFGLNVWDGIVDDYLFVWFLPPNLNGERCLHFLTVDLPTLLLKIYHWTHITFCHLYLNGLPPAHLIYESTTNGLVEQRSSTRGLHWSTQPQSSGVSVMEPSKEICMQTLLWTVEELCEIILNGIDRIRQTWGIFERMQHSMKAPGYMHLK